MKKAVCLLLALAVLLTVVSVACAEETSPAEPPAELFDLWDYGGESPSWIATAIPISEGVLIASATVKDIPADQLAVTDGEHIWEAAAVLPDEHSWFTLVFYNPGTSPARWGTWQLLPWGESVSASSCTVRFGDRMGSRIIRGVLGAEEISWQGQRCFLLFLTDPAPSGSPVLTADGQMAGVVIAQWAEGLNSVLVLPSDGVAGGVAEVAGLISGLPEWSETPQGLIVTADKNRVTIDWREMDLPEAPEGSRAYMVLVDTGNNYLTSYPADMDNRVITELLTPGRFYVAGLVISEGRPSSVPESYASIYIPQAEKVTEYGFSPVLTAVAEVPEGGLKEGEMPVPVTEVTEELLRSGRACFYSHSTYSVTENIEGKSLLITLTDPEGNNYRYESGWIYSPDYMAEDIWYLLLDETKLTSSLNVSGYPAGVYRIAYYIEGELADAFEFELK